jgi:hypothetical protein
MAPAIRVKSLLEKEEEEKALLRYRRKEARGHLDKLKGQILRLDQLWDYWSRQVTDVEIEMAKRGMSLAEGEQP